MERGRDLDAQTIEGLAEAQLLLPITIAPPPANLARDLGIAAVNRAGPLKRMFMRGAMGTGIALRSSAFVKQP